MGKLMGFFKSGDDPKPEEPRTRKPSSTPRHHPSKDSNNKNTYNTIQDHPPSHLTVPRVPTPFYEPGCCRYGPGIIVTRDKRTDQVRADWVSEEASQSAQSTYLNSSAPPPSQEPSHSTVRFLTSTLTSPPMPPQPTRRLPHPVFIPSRKPERRGPGWMTAYPPILDDCGIDESTFLAFLEDFNSTCKSSPTFDAVNLASMPVALEPDTTPMVVSLDVPLAVKRAKATQTEQQESLFLSLANAQLFEPVGLFALVTTFTPDQLADVVSVDVSAPATWTALGSGCPPDSTYMVKGTRGRPLKSELLYLMVVARPTDAEIEAAGATESDSTSATASPTQSYDTGPTSGARMSPQSLPRIDTLQVVLKMKDARGGGD